MNRSKLNLEGLEDKFDKLLSSFTEEDINEWNNFDEKEIRNEKL